MSAIPHRGFRLIADAVSNSIYPIGVFENSNRVSGDAATAMGGVSASERKPTVYRVPIIYFSRVSGGTNF